MLQTWLQPLSHGCHGRLLTSVNPTAQAPPSANHAPPQLYMLFLLNGYTYSTAHWVMLAL